MNINSELGSPAVMVILDGSSLGFKPKVTAWWYFTFKYLKE